jgi:ribosomal protein L28
VDIEEIPLFVLVHVKCKFTGKRNSNLRKIQQANKKARRMWPLDFIKRKSNGFYCVSKGRLRFGKRYI